MQWFRHTNNLRNEPKFRAIEKELGEAGYARAIKLFEIVAERGGKADAFLSEFSLAGITNIDWFSEELRISRKKAEKTLETFARVGLIDPQAWEGRIVRIPLLDEHLDEWTQRRKRSKLLSDSGVTRESLGSNSGATPVKSKSKRVEKEKEAEAEARSREKVAAATTAAAALLNKKTADHWDVLEILPCGITEFQEIWETIRAKQSDSEKTSDVMERCIQACKQCGVPVPKPFYDAKRKVESREFDEEVGPFLEGQEPPEIEKMSTLVCPLSPEEML